MSFVFEPFGGRSMLEVEASGRAGAFVEAYRHLTGLGFKVSVEKKETSAHPMDLTSAEISDIEAAEVPLDTRPSSGVRVIKIIYS